MYLGKYREITNRIATSMCLRVIILLTGLLFPFSLLAQSTPAQIMFVGCDHLQQVYRKGNPNTDAFTPRWQQELAEVVNRIKAYKPDLILVERLPADQPALDSLYTLFLNNKLALADLPDGRAEEYQLGFTLGKQLGLKKIVGVNAPGGTSQSILSNGHNIELYLQENARLRALVTEKYTQIQAGSLSFSNYIRFLNQPETVQKVYHLRYMTPARVTNGHFTNPDKMVDTAFVNPAYIGAELISVFKNRDYKIYSNIVTAQLAQQAKKIVVIIGVAHIGSLQSIFRDDPAYKLVESVPYLNHK
ncbi:DUF5694 domain-containing protein [Spirosoma utsteinense]|uniref:TraB/GumN family protein n=1 Tax=Spirosoma utsteinense TaxID=2585773 RepID=A0ABR6W2S4_9BACT|nr:DUF5694 domain-containing protein [Spirosoma utsteinense]MBC3784954.1 hypothetical protein [Spirosoma utsteinense]MBC3790438.1 hypothetical protein [Spirosoma utsteinense]